MKQGFGALLSELVLRSKALTWSINDGQVGAELVLDFDNNLALPELVLPFQSCILILDVFLQHQRWSWTAYRSLSVTLILLACCTSHLASCCILSGNRKIACCVVAFGFNSMLFQFHIMMCEFPTSLCTIGLPGALQG